MHAIFTARAEVPTCRPLVTTPLKILCWCDSLVVALGFRVQGPIAGLLLSVYMSELAGSAAFHGPTQTHRRLQVSQ